MSGGLFGDLIGALPEQGEHLRLSIAPVAAEGANGGKLSRFGPAGDRLRVDAEQLSHLTRGEQTFGVRHGGHRDPPLSLDATSLSAGFPQQIYFTLKYSKNQVYQD